MKKALIFILILLVVVGGAAWYFVAYRMDAMIEQQIETAGTRSLGTRVTVGTVNTNIKNGSLTISEVTVANPPGFKNTHAFKLNGIEAAVDYSNFEIKRVIIENPEIVIEELGGETNFSMMMAELERADSKPADTTPADETQPDGKDEPVVVIHHFRMNESRAAFESESLDSYANIKVDAVEMKNIKGTPSEVANQIANKILKEISKEAAIEVLKAQAKKKYGDTEIKVSKKFKDLFGKDDDDSSDEDAGKEDSGN